MYIDLKSTLSQLYFATVIIENMRLKYFTLFIFLLLYSCKTDDTVIEQAAVIKAGTNVQGFESCDWVIQFSNEFNTKVVPLSLDVAFQQNGLEVQVIVTNTTEVAECAAGNPYKVRIVSIRESN